MVFAVVSGMVLALLLGCDPEPDRTRVEGLPPEPPPRLRIVSLSALASRFAIELGVGAQLVGVDTRSSALPGLDDLPVVDLAGARELLPDLVLVPAPIDTRHAAVRDLEAAGAKIVEFTPHDFEDVFALCRGLGVRLVGTAAATLFERKIARPLALVGGISPPRGRLRVVAVVSLDPLELAGGHSFETDLIEIAGGTSVTHGGDELRIAMTHERWNEFSPDLVLITTATEADLAQRAAARARVPAPYPIEFFAFDRDFFWLEEPERDAERLRVIIASHMRTHQGG